jgi:hypothetical protein
VILALLSLLFAPVSLGAPWKNVAPGVQTAPAVELGGDAAWQARVVLVDPAKVQFLVRYDPSRPTLSQWRQRFPQALAVVNGSFYSLESAAVKPTCDLVTDGKPLRGAGCHRQDALFFGARPATPVRSSAPVSRAPAHMRPQLLPPADFRPEEWSEALKSFPALVRGGSAACGGPHYCAEASRTAAVAQLRDGRILLFASQWPAVRHDVAGWLAEQMGAVEALNLDGGPEATLAIKGEPVEEAIGTPSVGLPMVLLVVPSA